METKVCTKCGVEKPFSEYYNYPNRTDGKYTICKECLQIKLKSRRKPTPPPIKYPIIDGKKKCSKCGETKPISEFSKNKNQHGGIQSLCKSCVNQYCKDRCKSLQEINKRRYAGEFDSITHKICSDCGKDLPVSEYYKAINLPDGYSGRCKKCHRRWMNKRYAERHPTPDLEVIPVGFRKCQNCKQILPISDYHNSIRGKNGKQYTCKHCMSNYHYKKYRRDPHASWVTGTMTNHRKSGHNILFTKEWLLNLAKNTSNCPLCGESIDWEVGNKRILQQNSPSLDRKNNAIDLTEEEVWIICYRCNSAKGPHTVQEFLNYCKHIVKSQD